MDGNDEAKWRGAKDDATTRWQPQIRPDALGAVRAEVAREAPKQPELTAVPAMGGAPAPEPNA